MSLAGGTKQKKPVNPFGLTGLRVGGGGGTADPRLSPRAGLCLHPVARMRSVLSAQSLRILVFARREPRISEPMSLYRAGLKLALFLPLGVAMPPCGGE